MEFSSLLIVIFIFILSGIFILRPFLVEEKSTKRSGSARIDPLVAEKERLLLAIEELDLEFELEKISSQEYNRNRDILLSEAAEVIKQLDKYQKTGSGKKKASAPPETDDNLERMIHQRRLQLRGEKSLKCPKCGKAVDKGAQFCSHCGEAL
jgi:hypothetical protein